MGQMGQKWDGREWDERWGARDKHLATAQTGDSLTGFAANAKGPAKRKSAHAPPTSKKKKKTCCCRPTTKVSYFSNEGGSEEKENKQKIL